MALRKEDWPAIAKAIADAVAAQQPRGWRRAVFILRELGPLIGIISAVLALIAITCGALYQAWGHVKEETVFRTHTEDRLTTVEGQLKDILGELAKQSVISHTSLPMADFKASLPDLRSAIAAAKEQNIKVSPKILGDLQEKLTASTDAPSFWPTAADFINYRSQIVSNDIQTLMRADLPNCTDHDPTPMELKVNPEFEKHGKVNDTFMLPNTPEGKDDKGNQLVPARYEDCRFVLDSPEQADRIPFVANRLAFRLTFKHCQIAYRGGPISLLASTRTMNSLRSKAGFAYLMTGQRLYFENCLFLFAINYQPPAEGQWLTKQLLTQSGTELTVTAPKTS